MRPVTSKTEVLLKRTHATYTANQGQWLQHFEDDAKRLLVSALSDVMRCPKISSRQSLGI